MRFTYREAELTTGRPAGSAIRPVRRMLLEFHYRTQMNPRHAESALLINDAVRYVPLNAQTTLGREATISFVTSFVTRRNFEIGEIISAGREN